MPNIAIICIIWCCGMIRAIAKDRREGDERLRSQLADWKFPARVAEELTEHNTKVDHLKGSVIFSRGSPADVLYWIRSGLVDLYFPLDDGNRVLARLCGPGDILGYTDFVDDTGHRVQAFDAVARTKSQVAFLTYEHVREVLSQLDPQVVVQLLERCKTIWSIELQHWVQFVGMHFRRRLELVLTDLARRYGVTDDRGTLLVADLSHETLAQMIGSSRPIVSRLLADMTKERIIARHGGRYLLRNIPNLRA
jgi:CRP-like cAMP-binding protein